MVGDSLQSGLAGILLRPGYENAARTGLQGQSLTEKGPQRGLTKVWSRTQTWSGREGRAEEARGYSGT